MSTDTSISMPKNVAEMSLSQVSVLIKMLDLALTKVENPYPNSKAVDSIPDLNDDSFDV